MLLFPLLPPQQQAASVPLPGSPVIEDGGLVGDDDEDAKVRRGTEAGGFRLGDRV